MAFFFVLVGALAVVAAGTDAVSPSPSIVVHGRILDALSDAPIPLARVIVTDTCSKERRQLVAAFTREDGSFRLRLVSPLAAFCVGAYDVRYQSFRHETPDAQSGVVSVGDIRLSPVPKGSVNIHAFTYQYAALQDDLATRDLKVREFDNHVSYLSSAKADGALVAQLREDSSIRLTLDAIVRDNREMTPAIEALIMKATKKKSPKKND